MERQVTAMSKITSFYKLLNNNVKKHPDKMAILYDTYDVSYENFLDDCIKKANHLKKFPGKRISLYGPASYRWIVNLFGIIMSGKDAVLLDFFLPHSEREKLLERVNTDYVLTSTNQYILADNNAIMIPGAEKEEGNTEWDVDEACGEGNILMFTATSKESDKAVVLTTKNLLNTANAISSHCMCEPEDRVLVQISLHHIFGLVYGLLWPLTCGACVCVGRGLRHIDADTHYYNPTILPGTPSMVEYLKKVKALNKELTTVIIGGASCSFRLFEYLKDRDLRVYTIYGMTECSGCIAINKDMDGSYDIYEGTTVKIAKDGELLISGPCVMAGYDNDKAATDAVVQDKVFHTGDYGHFNSHGRLILDRRNPDILHLSTGEKICSKVINDEITAISGIAESYLTIYGDKLTTLVVPIDKKARYESIKKKIDKYNEHKGYRWEIQKLVVLDRPIPRLANYEIDIQAIGEILDEKVS